MSSESQPDTAPLTLAIAATFTAKSIDQPLAFWMEELDLPTRIAFAPYSQVFQQLLDPSSLLSTNRHGFNVMLIRLEDWRSDFPPTSRPTGDSDWRVDLQRKASDFVAALAGAAERSSTPYLVVLCPLSPEVNADPEQAQCFKQAEELIVSAAAPIPGVHLVNDTQLPAAFPDDVFCDPYGERIAHAPYTQLCLTALATSIARRLYSLTQTGYKAIIVDCDNTLWTGACGEEGALEIELTPAHHAIQDFLIELHDRGVLLCLCSRNNEADVLAVFDRRSHDMHLTLEHVVSSKFNWRPKSENIRAIASELRLAPDAFIFLDDDPVECAEVQANCPEVLTFLLPTELDRIPVFLRHLWIFDGSRTTEEAAHRTAWYRQNAARERALPHSPSLEEFLDRLDLKIHITELIPRHLARASDLTYRTNQFNTTTIRRSEAEIQALCQQGTEALVVQVKDRFGDYGLVGLVLFSSDADALKVDTFLLSCRALGRGVEHRMLARLGEMATERGLTHVDLAWAPSARNRPALDFLREAAGALDDRQGTRSVCRIPAHVAATARYRVADVRPSSNEQSVAPEPQSLVTHVNARAKAALLASIANNLADPKQVEAVVSAQRRVRPELERAYVEPRTPVERTVAGILARVLGLDRVGLEDDFFRLGGHSLLAMQVLFRIREAYHVELPPRVLYEGAFTAADLARKVLQAQLQAADPTRVAALLDRLNQLSDDEVRALLVRHEAGQKI